MARTYIRTLLLLQIIYSRSSNCHDFPLQFVRSATTGNWPYPDGQINADGCRRPTLRYADSHVLAVGVPWPSGYHELSRRHPSAYICRRPSCEHGDSSRRRTRGPGDPARDQRLTPSNLCRRSGRAAVGISPHATSPIRGVGMPTAAVGISATSPIRGMAPTRTLTYLCRRLCRRHSYFFYILFFHMF